MERQLPGWVEAQEVAATWGAHHLVGARGVEAALQVVDQAEAAVERYCLKSI